MSQHRVYQAQPYRSQSMGSFGDASYMLIRQHCFPDTYDEHDLYEQADHDRCFQRDFELARNCFEKHTGKGDMAFGSWARSATHETIIAFLVDILRADTSVKWTGYRIMGTVNRGNGYPVWTLELFAKHPDSATKVYSGENAPNVKARGVSTPRRSDHN